MGSRTSRPTQLEASPRQFSAVSKRNRETPRLRFNKISRPQQLRASMAHTIQLQNVSAPHQVHIVLYNNVTNATTLRDKLLAGDEAFEYAFIDATTVGSTEICADFP